MSRPRTRLAAGVVAGLLLASCGGAEDPATERSSTSASSDAGEAQGDDAAGGGDATGGMDDTDAMDDDMDADDMDDDMGDMAGAYGEPADASEAERTIEVVVDNGLAFEPAEYEVAAGEVVTFQITNTGDIEHEFVLGDEQAQQQMGEEMSEEMGDGHAHSGEMSNAVTIHGGEEAELTWRFPEEATTVLVGCHVPGHWDAGMRGSVTVG
jgi:uncharacterized cupredoxin-like copper-binding protein